MLGRISSAVQSAVDTIVPPVPLLEDFLYHWRMITKFYSHTSSSFREPIESTNVGAHVDQLLKILIEEGGDEKKGGEEASSADNDDMSTGPCLEYLLEHRVLDVFATLASADQPIGMRTSCLEFFSRFLPHIRPTILPHVAIIAPVKKVVGLCLHSKASPTEVEEVNFLCSLCAVLGKNPPLTTVYMGMCEDNQANSTQDPPESEDSPRRLHLCNALLNHLQSADYRVVLRASEGLMLLASLPFDSVADTLLRCGLHLALPTQLASLFAAIPPNLDPNHLDDVRATWGLDSPQWLEGSKFPGCHQVAAFLAWLDYCDQMVRESHPTVGSALAIAIKEKFFKGCLQESLQLADDGTSLILSTAHLTKCVRMISAPYLLEELCHWLVGEESEYSDSNGSANREPGNCVLHLLLDNCVHEVDEVSLESLRLFEVLIEESRLEAVVHSLALKHLLSRSYCSRRHRPSRHKPPPPSDSAAPPPPQTQLVDWSDKESEEIQAPASPGCLRASRTLAPHNISEIIACFLNILPDQLRTCEPSHLVSRGESADYDCSGEEEEEGVRSSSSACGYEQYIQEANRQYREVFVRCAAYSWPREAKSPESEDSSSPCSSPSPSPSPPPAQLSTAAIASDDDSAAELTSCDSRPEADVGSSQFDEGPFLSMLIARLENLPYQAHEINLQTTALVSRLALLPHAHLHEWLLNPLLPTAPGCATVYAALQTAADIMAARVPLVPDFEGKLSSMRRALLGATDDPPLPPPTLDEEEARMLKSVIVLEEFCKELVAIAFVKYHYSS
ncbi:FHF complex subunit HOOK interacting protein 2A-like [Ischnura elegans]|uniref:FHF complex subunit HOOK interacting protein 2A-like n=1 Tax=Ischnura elegans TaxID=197161 RepID=UPI001ED8B1CF|nr:FHF complex subunit HOOK interacting protein 2A-like [Ischnura elegans]XP_046385234.1 FHF complex subunit HOOK interacting protein 2A-like [Ischnura elegans]